ncbi:Aldo-keto reductase-like protein 11 [Elsinoe fawcettii]|nr:Aldo-keto reductase-like protein 11 [Elsinoe fawcettii]
MPPDNSQPLNTGPLILGGAGFSSQLTPTPHQVPAIPILLRSFALGIRTIDTSPYYHPSEEILGAALSSPSITALYPRERYQIMTKAGRIQADEFDYSPAWIEKSVRRSLERFRTGYLDVVFCHDVEFVSLEEAVGAVGKLMELRDQGVVRYVGVSGYALPQIVAVVRAVKERLGRPVDVVQSWAQLTLQNTRLETQGLAALREAGVRAVASSSPLACGLLREGGVPVGALGDWHPAPEGLRGRSQVAAENVASQGEKLPAVALRFAIRKAVELTSEEMTVSTITGVGSLEDLEENAAAARGVLGEDISPQKWTRPARKEDIQGVNRELKEKDEVMFKRVREVLGEWIDYDFSAPKDTKP